MSPLHEQTRRPILLSLATLVVAVLIYFAKVYGRELSDSIFHFDLALINIFAGACIVVLSILWVIWLWFRSGWSGFFSRFLPAVLVIAGIGFLVGYRPVMKGGLGIDRWEPRFWQARDFAFEQPDNKQTDLSATTPFDFPQFLGPNRDGVIKNFGTELTDVKDQRSLVWKSEIGEGWSGIAAVNGFAVTMMQVGGDEVVVCYDIQTGIPHWTHRHVGQHSDFLGGLGPRSTPTIHDGRVYAMGAVGTLVCLDGRTGQLIWQQKMPELLQIEVIETQASQNVAVPRAEQSTTNWGRSGSPLVVGNLVIVPGGGPRDGKQVSLVAFDRLSGEEKWRGGDDGIGYASPVLANLAGRAQVIIVNESTVSGHVPTTGDVLWSFPWPGHSDSDANTSQSTVVDGNHILLSKGYGVGAELINVTAGASGEFAVQSVWKNRRVLKTKLTSPVVHDGYAYGLSDGILECADLKDGQRKWKKGRYGHGQLLLVGDKLLIHSEDGRLLLVDASPNGFVESGNSFETIDGICWNTFCVYDHFVLVRSDLEIACYLMADPRGRQFEMDTPAQPNATTQPND